MGWIELAGQVFKLVFFFLNLWSEGSKEKAKKKSEIGKELVDAFSETDKKLRASRINNVLSRIKRV